MTLDFQQLALLAILGTAIHWLGARAAITEWFWGLRWWPTKTCPHCEDDYMLVDGVPQHACNGPEYLRIQVCGRPMLRNAAHHFVTKLLACAACAGWWLGLAGGLLGIQPLVLGPTWLNVLGAGLGGIVVVPVLEGALMFGLHASHIE